MDFKEQDVLSFLGQLSRYKIPIYQRRYSWDNPQWSQLFSDILAIQARVKHFLGSIVLTCPDGGNAYNSYQYIIDGQQRIITLSVLLKAIHDVASSLEDCSVRKRIMDFSLIFPHDETDNRFRVQPLGDDFFEYRALFSEQPGSGDSRLARCYRFFRDGLENLVVAKGKSLAAFTFSLQSLYFLVLVLQPNDDAQVIFESINATGLALTESDKIRNFILMKCSSDLQRHYYHDYWEKIEKNTGDDINNFIRYYLMAAKGGDARIKSLYEDFKGVWVKEDVQKNIEGTLSELLRYSVAYRDITVPDAFPYSQRSELSKVLFRLTRGKLLRLASPFLLKAIDYCQSVGREQDILPILTTIEAFNVRRLVCQINRNADTGTFRPLHSRVMQIMGEENRTYPDALEIALLRNRRNSRFPTDAEFHEKFISFQLYTTLPKEMQLYLIARLEAGDSKEGESHRDVLDKFKDANYTIEHIMPRKLTPEWLRELGACAQNVHETYLHTIGNITISAYNPCYSNRTFAEKKSIANGFDYSPIRLNAYLKNINCWNQSAILDRAEWLFKKALKLWPVKAVSLQRSALEERPLNLHDDFAFTNLKSYQYKGKRVSGDSWTRALTDLLKTIKEANSENFFVREINDDWWENVISRTHTNSKIRILKRLFKSCGLDERDLIFFVEPKNEGDDDVNLLDYSAAAMDGDDQDEAQELGASYGGEAS